MDNNWIKVDVENISSGTNLERSDDSEEEKSKTDTNQDMENESQKELS